MFGLTLRFPALRGAAVLGLLLSGGCGDPDPSPDTTTSTSDGEMQISDQHVAEIRAFCGHCHGFPQPASFPKEAWKAEVAQGFRLFHDDPIKGLHVPSEEITTAWYISQAPEKLPQNDFSDAQPDQRFVAETDWNATQASAVSVACLRSDATNTMWSCDMRTGAILSAAPGAGMQQVARPLELLNPCRITRVDLDRDGQDEILVSDLGSFLPQDHQKGGIWSFSAQNDWAETPVITGISRVSDVQPGDFDGDGDTDLIVAEFGWRRTGSVFLLWNDGTGQWDKSVLDDRHGAIDVPVVDLNGDGLPDIVGLLAQEHEKVVAWINSGTGEFAEHTIYEAGDPSFGSSGIQVVDFDGDGDLDVLHTNGDSFDDGYLKPYHGIRWLEQTSPLKFTSHELAAMPGVHRAIAADIDRDGDNDVVAVSLLPPTASGEAQAGDSVIWLEQTQPGHFQRHVVEKGNADHAACLLADWDHDGDLDLCVTHFQWNETPARAVTWYKNKTIEGGAKTAGATRGE